MDAFDDFEQTCRDAFRFLCDRYGFQPPEVERIGRESYVQFHKGPRTVSIAWGPGGPPVVELFLPTSGSGLPETPWAEREGVPYSRRFPRSASPARTSSEARSRKVIERESRRRWSNPAAQTFDAYLSERAGALEQAEIAFLSGD